MSQAPAPAPTAAEIVQAVTSLSGHRERLRRLREHESRYGAELVEAFRKNADVTMRRIVAFMSQPSS